MNTNKQKAVREHVEQFREIFKKPIPALYRWDLFRRVQNARYGSNVSRLGLREIAADCKLSVGTVDAALKGNATKIETVYILAEYFGIPLFVLFDQWNVFVTEVKDDGTGIDWKVIGKIDAGSDDAEKGVKISGDKKAGK